MLKNLRHVIKLMFKYEITYVSIDVHEPTRIEVRFDAKESKTFKTGVEAVNHIKDGLALDAESYSLVETMVKEAVGTLVTLGKLNIEGMVK